jgi:hypothetical protein
MTKTQEMTQEQIEEVFETLRLPDESFVSSPPPVVQAPAAPMIFFTIGGTSPPLKTAG